VGEESRVSGKTTSKPGNNDTGTLNRPGISAENAQRAQRLVIITKDYNRVRGPIGGALQTLRAGMQEDMVCRRQRVRACTEKEKNKDQGKSARRCILYR